MRKHSDVPVINIVIQASYGHFYGIFSCACHVDLVQYALVLIHVLKFTHGISKLLKY